VVPIARRNLGKPYWKAKSERVVFCSPEVLPSLLIRQNNRALLNEANGGVLRHLKFEGFTTRVLFNPLDFSSWLDPKEMAARKGLKYDQCLRKIQDALTGQPLLK